MSVPEPRCAVRSRSIPPRGVAGEIPQAAGAGGLRVGLGEDTSAGGDDERIAEEMAAPGLRGPPWSRPAPRRPDTFTIAE